MLKLRGVEIQTTEVRHMRPRIRSNTEINLALSMYVRFGGGLARWNRRATADAHSIYCQ